MFSKEQKEWARRREAQSLSKLSAMILAAYRVRALRPLCLRLASRLEGGVFFSKTLRQLLRTYHGVSVGAYSYGPCLRPGGMPAGTQIGAYCSLADGIKVRRRNHPSNTLSQHPFFYNAAVGLLEKDTIRKESENPLIIGNDVWIGDNVLIMPKCKMIGNGAMIGAGSVVTKDVPSYTIVAGNPARPLADRYDEDTKALLEEARWWEMTLPDLLGADDLLLQAITPDRLRMFGSKLGSAQRSG